MHTLIHAMLLLFINPLKTFISVNITLQLLVCELNFMEVWYISVVSDLGFWKGAIKIQFIINAILIAHLWN